MKLQLLALLLLSNLVAQAQVPTPTLQVTQPTCMEPTGSVEVTAPINNTAINPVLSNLFISEVTDQTAGGLSYIELYNATGAAVNLANYKILVYSNGNTAPTCNLTLSGTIANNAVKVIAVGSSTNQGGVIPDLSFPACGGVNNNDNISLITSTSVLVDTWGRTDGVVFTPSNSGYVYRRNPNSLHPSTTWNPADWTASTPEDYTNVGAYTQGSYYQYSLDNGPWQTSTVFSNLNIGTYGVQAKDLVTGAVSMTAVVVFESPIPSVNFIYGPSTICTSSTFSHLPIMFGIGNYLGGTFSSSPGLVINPVTGEIIASASTPGSYLVNYILPSNMGCPAISASTQVVLLPIPIATIAADGNVISDITINNGDAVQLQVNAVETISNVQWSPATALITTAQPNTFIAYPSVTTNYTAYVNYNSGCTTTAAITINVNQRPNLGSISITTPNSTIGLFDTLALDVQLTNASDVYSLLMKLKGNAAVNQYLDFDSYTTGTLLGSGASITNTTPTIANGIVDFGISKVGSVPGYNGSGVFYTLRFKPKNIAIPNGTSFCFYIDDVNATDTAANSCGLTNQGQICVTFTNQVPVWPGDLDKSNTVTTADLLPIGYFYNRTGSGRPNANLNWVAQPATLWGYNHSAPNNDGYTVFADGNGDGTVTDADETAIVANLNQSHARLGGNATVPPNSVQTVGGLVITPNSTTINTAALPQTMSFTVSVNNSGGLNTLYGINTNLVFDPAVFDLTTATVDYTGSIFGNTGSDCLVLKNASASVLSVAMTRYANAAITGQGTLFKVTLQTKANIAALTETSVNGYSDVANNQQGEPLSIANSAPTTLNITNLGIETNTSTHFVLYPNPFKDNLTITSKTVIKKVRVYNLLGQLVLTKTQNSEQVILDLSGLSANSYLIQVESDEAKEVFKVIKE